MHRKRTSTGSESSNGKRTRLGEASTASTNQTAVNGATGSTSRSGYPASPGVRLRSVIRTGHHDEAERNYSYVARSQRMDPYQRDSGSYVYDRHGYQRTGTTSNDERHQPNSRNIMEARARSSTTPTLRSYVTIPARNHRSQSGEARRREEANRDSRSGSDARPRVRIPVGTAQTGRNYSNLARVDSGSYLSDQHQTGATSRERDQPGYYGDGSTSARPDATPTPSSYTVPTSNHHGQFVEAPAWVETYRDYYWSGSYHTAPRFFIPVETVGIVASGRDYPEAARTYGTNYWRDPGFYMRVCQRSYTVPAWNHHEQSVDARRPEGTTELGSGVPVGTNMTGSSDGAGRNSGPSNLANFLIWINESINNITARHMEEYFRYMEEMYAMEEMYGQQMYAMYSQLYRPRRRRNGLSAGEIGRLPTRLFVCGDDNEGDSSQTQCLICLDDYEQGDRLRILGSCVHVFHSFCVDPWLERNATCPTCRTAVTGARV